MKPQVYPTKMAAPSNIPLLLRMVLGDAFAPSAQARRFEIRKHGPAKNLPSFPGAVALVFPHGLQTV